MILSNPKSLSNFSDRENRFLLHWFVDGHFGRLLKSFWAFSGVLETVKNADTTDWSERKAMVKITVFDDMIYTISVISTYLFDPEMAILIQK